MLHEIALSELHGNPFQMFGKDWALVTSGDKSVSNTMTVSWGEMGVLWNKNIVTVFIRPQRYTRELLDRFENFTLSFYGENCRDALRLCGTKSGRDMDKISAAGLTPVFEDDTVYFSEARLVLECRKIYMDRLRPECFLDPSIQENYPKNDYHIVYIGEITKVLSK